MDSAQVQALEIVPPKGSRRDTFGAIQRGCPGLEVIDLRPSVGWQKWAGESTGQSLDWVDTRPGDLLVSRAWQREGWSVAPKCLILAVRRSSSGFSAYANIRSLRFEPDRAPRLWPKVADSPLSGGLFGHGWDFLVRRVRRVRRER